jgi:hypothetical protein
LYQIDVHLAYFIVYLCHLYTMGRLKIYDINIPRESIVAERAQIYLNRFAEQKFFSLLKLDRISVQMNGGEPLKKPQSKGIVISKPNTSKIN